MGCKYNIDEFKPFVSGKKKIIPAVTDDWQLVNETFNSKHGVALYSEKLSVKVYDLDFSNFLRFLKDENVTLIGDKIQGKFIIGQARVLRKESDYLETTKLKTERVSESIPKSEWEPGMIYETACGSKIIFFGEVWTQSLNVKNGEPKLSKITKKYMGIDFYGYNQISSWHSAVNISTKKLVRKIGPAAKFDKRKNRFYNKYKESTVLFSETKPDTKNLMYGFELFTSRFNNSPAIINYEDKWLWNEFDFKLFSSPDNKIAICNTSFIIDPNDIENTKGCIIKVPSKGYIYSNATLSTEKYPRYKLVAKVKDNTEI